MSVYNNEAYREMVNEFLNEIYYVEGMSYGTKIEKIRQYTEIIIRRLLKYDQEEQLTLGNRNIKKQLRASGYTEQWFITALKNICKKGNLRSHTQMRKIAEVEEYNEVENSLFDLYGYLFYDFFKRYRFGTNKEIVTVFSYLPPIVRYTALQGLFERDGNNLDVIDKFALAILKAKDRGKAEEWLELNKNKFVAMSSVDEAGKQDIINQVGPELGEIIISSAPNMYDLCCERVKKVDSALEGKILYDSFETALSGYREFGHVTGETEEVKEFNQLMEFVFMGRKEQEKKIKNTVKSISLLDSLASDFDIEIDNIS